MEQNVFQCSVSFYGAAVNQDDAVADGFGFIKQMSGNQNGFMAAEFADLAADVFFLIRIEPVGRFIQQQYRRVAQNALGESDPAAVAFGERFNFLIPDAVYLRQAADSCQALVFFTAGESSQFGNVVQKSFDGKVRVEGEPSGRKPMFCLANRQLSVILQPRTEISPDVGAR